MTIFDPVVLAAIDYANDQSHPPALRLQHALLALDKLTGVNTQPWNSANRAATPKDVRRLRAWLRDECLTCQGWGRIAAGTQPNYITCPACNGYGRLRVPTEDHKVGPDGSNRVFRLTKFPLDNGT